MDSYDFEFFQVPFLLVFKYKKKPVINEQW